MGLSTKRKRTVVSYAEPDYNEVIDVSNEIVEDGGIELDEEDYLDSEDDWYGRKKVRSYRHSDTSLNVN